MKILIVCGEYFNQSNGLSLSTQRFVEQFKRLGDEVRVLSSDHGGISEYSVPVMRVPLVDGIMDRQNYHFAKPVRQVIREALSWAEEDRIWASAAVLAPVTRSLLPKISFSV